MNDWTLKKRVIRWAQEDLPVLQFAGGVSSLCGTGPAPLDDPTGERTFDARSLRSRSNPGGTATDVGEPNLRHPRLFAGRENRVPFLSKVISETPNPT